MPPLRGLPLADTPSAVSRAGVLNGRPGSASALPGRRAGSPGGKSEPLQSDILAALKQAARQEPAAALRELQRLHSQLTGAAGSKALASLEGAWQQATPGVPGGGTGMPGASNATGAALNAQQRELNQLTMQRQRLQQQQREQRTELHSVTSELDKRKNELRQVTDQLKARRNMLKGSGSPRPPSPPRGSPNGANSPSGDGAGAPSTAELAVPRLSIDGAKPKPASPPSASKAKGSGEGEGGEGDESAAEKLEGVQEELEDARGDLQLTISDLRVILEATPAFVCAVDPHGHVSGWNTAAIEITGLRRDGVLQRHFVEHFVPQQHQQAAADAMETAFSLPADDPLAGEPGEPFELNLWRGGDRSATVCIRVRAYARRLAGGQPVGLLLIQDDATQNDAMRERTNLEREMTDLQGVIALREQELDEHESEMASLRAELQTFYEERAKDNGRTLSKPGGPKQPVGILSKGAAAGQPGSGQRINWGAPNKVGHFTRGSSPREFGNKMRHDQMRSESLGSAPQAQQQSAPAPQRV